MRVQLRSVAAIALTLALLMIAGAAPILAQDNPAASPLPNLLVQVYSADQGAKPYFTVFTPDGQTAFNETYENTQTVFYAPDGTSKAVFTVLENGGGTYTVGTPAGDASFEGAINYTYVTATYSQDSRWFLYSEVQADPKHWLLGIFEIATGKRLEFIGKYDATGPLGENRVGYPIDFDGARVLLTGIYPFSESSFGGLYAMPLPDLTPVSPGQYGMPNMTILVGADSNVGYWKLSPNGKALAYMVNDTANPPSAFTPFGPAPIANVLKTVDLSNTTLAPTPITLAAAGPGQALGAFAWSPDSTKVFFTGGNFQNTPYLVLANLYVVALADTAVTPLGLSVTEPSVYISQMQACGTMLYATINRDSTQSGGSDAILVGAPLETPAAFRSLATGLGFFLTGCTARS